MNSEKVKKFLALAGHASANPDASSDPKLRTLGAQLLMSELLEYVIRGLKVKLTVNGQEITDPESLNYQALDSETDRLEMIDGLADVAYTMFWNSEVFGVPLEQAYDLVCDNNLSKFVKLEQFEGPKGLISRHSWHCEKQVSWPDEVKTVEAIQVGQEWFAVGKDAAGKVRKPSSYAPVDLSTLLAT